MINSRAEISLINQSCILCGSKDYFLVFEKECSFDFDCDGFHQRILVCKKCGLSTIEDNETYSDQNLNNYYRSVPRTPVQINEIEKTDPRVKNAGKRIEFIRKVTSGKSMLEIGFGDGITLLQARNNGYDVTGIDVTEGYSELYNFLVKKGITIYNDNIFEAIIEKSLM